MWTTISKPKTLFKKKLRSTTWFSSFPPRFSISVALASHIVALASHPGFSDSTLVRVSSLSIAFTSFHHQFKYSKVHITKSTLSVIVCVNRRKSVSKTNRRLTWLNRYRILLPPFDFQLLLLLLPLFDIDLFLLRDCVCEFAVIDSLKNSWWSVDCCCVLLFFSMLNFLLCYEWVNGKNGLNEKMCWIKNVDSPFDLKHECVFIGFNHVRNSNEIPNEIHL